MSPEILIVGSGPTGLTLANALAYYGVPFTIIDKNSGPTADSKGLAINVSSILGFDQIGLKDLVGKNGCVINKLNLFWKGKRLNSVNFSFLDSPYNSLITQSQKTTEQELLSALNDKGLDVVWGSTLFDLKLSGDHAITNIKDKSGKLHKKQFDLVVGCDGKYSLVRDALHAEFSGSDYLMYFALGDFQLNIELDNTQVYYHVFEDTFIVIVPIDSDYWRVVVKYDGAPPEGKVSDEEITDVVSKYLGPDYIKKNESRWVSRAPFYRRTVDKLKEGQLFLAGDSAHLFSPLGGSGMNTGIQDALNLSWKLALCYYQYGKPSLFDDYEIQRKEVMETTSTLTDRITRVISRSDKSPESYTSFLPTMKNRKSMRFGLPLAHSGLNFSYQKAFQKDTGTAINCNQKAGDLFLDRLNLIQHIKNQVTSLEPLVLLGIMCWEMSDGENALLTWNAIQHKYINCLLCIAIVPKKISQKMINTYPDIFMITRRQWKSICELSSLNVNEKSLMMVYPDTTIGFSGSISELEVLDNLLEQQLLSAVKIK